ncbi:uncharacterized protein VTP21DRAFT_2814 [Calcarisporiella thermophila]|uniref:uncharacterized protein n=1 Tax=Calcarisporiella thermophila TaxID=911321 RepID=UPI0037449B41
MESQTESGISLHNYLQLVLKNTESTARDHMANERTFLSWLELTMALVILGLTLVFPLPIQVEDWKHYTPNLISSSLGISFCGVGFIALVGALLKYFKNQNHLVKQGFVEHGRKSFFIAYAIAFILAMAMVITIALGSTRY